MFRLVYAYLNWILDNQSHRLLTRIQLKLGQSLVWIGPTKFNSAYNISNMKPRREQTFQLKILTTKQPMWEPCTSGRRINLWLAGAQTTYIFMLITKNVFYKHIVLQLWGPRKRRDCCICVDTINFLRAT